jgi:hypothetical protein
VIQAAIIAGAIGFFVPLYWLSLGMLLFAGPPVLPDLFWSAIPWTCPACLLPGFWMLLAPVANALLYAAVCVVARVGLGPRGRLTLEAMMYVSDGQRGFKPVLIAERVWFALSITAGSVLTYLSEPFSLHRPLSETVFGIVFSLIVFSAFVYAFFGMGRVFVWTIRMPGAVPR